MVYITQVLPDFKVVGKRKVATLTVISRNDGELRAAEPNVYIKFTNRAGAKRAVEAFLTKQYISWPRARRLREKIDRSILRDQGWNTVNIFVNDELIITNKQNLYD